MICNRVFFLMCCVVLCNGDQFEDDCGWEATYSTPLVKAGKFVQPNQFPWHVAIFLGEGDLFEQICGGSLVRSQLVITAAHCFSQQSHNHRINVADYRVAAGIILASWTATEMGKQTSEVREIHLGEDYGGIVRNWQDDIAIVKLTKAFTYSDTVRAVCLDLADGDLYTRQTSPGSVGKVAGWGLTEAVTLSDELNFLAVPVVGKEECLREIPSTFKSYYTSDKICAGLTNGSAVCPGDSGGGLVFPLQNTSTSPPRWYLRAVLSNAPISNDENNPCLTNVYALYTNTFKHQNWLFSNLENLRGGCRVAGSVGVCRNFTDCPGSKEEAFLGIPPQNCLPSNPGVCCVASACPSTVPQRKTGSKANDYCVNLAEKFFPCQKNGSGWSRGDLCGPAPSQHQSGYGIVPLAKASPSEVQRYALLGLDDFDWRMSFAFLVSERWLLLRTSEWNYEQTRPGRNLTSAPAVIFTVSRTVLHPQYLLGNTTAQESMVLLELDKPVTFSKSLRPVCLHAGDPLHQDSVGGLTISGWNIFKESLYQSPVELLHQEECARRFPTNDTKGRSDGVTDRHVCVSLRTGEACANGHWHHLKASNGYKVACTQLLVGLRLDYQVDGNNCVLLYLRVATHVPWVESIVWP